jgi:hypothetical protein
MCIIWQMASKKRNDNIERYETLSMLGTTVSVSGLLTSMSSLLALGNVNLQCLLNVLALIGHLSCCYRACGILT